MENTAEDIELLEYPEHKRNIKLAEAVALYAWHGKHHLEHIRQAKRNK